MATKNTPKAPADPAAAPTTDANAPAPAPDTTEANNADGPEQLPEAPAADQAAAEPAADGAAEPAQAEAPQVTEPEQPPAPPQPEPVLPAKIRLTCPFGFMDDDNVPHWWGAGQEVTDPAEIKTLVAYNAEHEVLE